MPSDRKYNRITLFVIAIAFLSLYFLCISYPDLDHGDTWDDAASLNAGNNFVKFGFIKCRFLAVRGYNLNSPDGSFYTHIPPFSEIFNALLKIVFHTNSLIFFRVISVLFSILSVWLWFLVIKRILSPQVGVLFILFYITNPYFIELSDSLHHYVYSDFLLPLILYIFISYLYSTGKRKIYFWVLLALLFIQMFVSFEYVIFSYLFMLGYCLLFDKKINLKSWLALIFASLFAFAVKILQNAWALGGIGLAVKDLCYTSLRRIAGLQASEPEAVLIFSRFILIFKRNFMFVRINYPLLFLSPFFILYYQLGILLRSGELGLLKKEELFNLKHLKLLFLIFICGVSWWVIFPSYNIVHGYPARHLIPAMALLLSIYFYTILIIIAFIKSKYIRITTLCLCILFIISITGNNIMGSRFSRIWKAEDINSFLKDDNFINSVRSCVLPGEYAYVNWWNDQLLSYYADRNFIGAPSMEGITENKRKAGVFLYFDDGNNPLRNFLRKNYPSVAYGEFYEIFDLRKNKTSD